MQTPTQAQNRLCSLAIDAEESGDADGAATLFRQAVACNTDNPVPYLFLGFALHTLGQDDKAVQAWSLAADLDPRVINSWHSESVAEDIRQRSKIADKSLRGHFTALHRAAIDQYQQQHPPADLGRAAAAIWCQTHDAEFDYQHPRQRPHLFFVPELAAIPVYADEHMPWRAGIEAACDDIKAEFLAARETVADEERPYLEPKAAGLGEDWKPIADSLNWGSFHLYKQGVPNKRLLDVFPVTLEALREVPTIEGGNGPREVVFSVLQGRQRIPPHFGVSNTDMTVHLPIITSEQSAIRVDDDVYEWREGNVFAFDDAFDHESWNDSPEPRVNLLFEAWHPDLTEHERGAIEATFNAREAWNGARSV